MEWPLSFIGRFRTLTRRVYLAFYKKIKITALKKVSGIVFFLILQANLKPNAYEKDYSAFEHGGALLACSADPEAYPRPKEQTDVAEPATRADPDPRCGYCSHGPNAWERLPRSFWATWVGVYTLNGFPYTASLNPSEQGTGKPMAHFCSLGSATSALAIGIRLHWGYFEHTHMVPLFGHACSEMVEMYPEGNGSQCFIATTNMAMGAIGIFFTMNN